MKSKWAYPLVILFMGLFGYFAVFKANYVKQPVEVMRVTNFERTEQIGVALARRFYYPLETQKIVMFGIPDSPAWNLDIVRGFVRAAKEEKIPFDVILMQETMDDLALTDLPELKVETVNMNTQTQAEFIDRVKALKAEGKRILVYGPSIFTTHLLEGNAINRYEKITGEKVLSITTGPLSTSHAEEKVIQPACVGSERDMAGTNDLSCRITWSSRMIYRNRKVKDYKDFIAIMNSSQPEDFLLMVADPEQKKLAARPN